MRNEDRISQLIEELKDLRVRETAILEEIELRNSLREASQRDSTPRDSADTPRNSSQAYKPGDRVYITNRVNRPVFAPPSWTGFKERRATVTKVVGERVHFKTDNGTATWRAARNIRLVAP